MAIFRIKALAQKYYMENIKKDLLIVVPYRNREEHLKGFLENSPKYFEKQNFTYDILICELAQTGDWNAGLSCNSLVDFTKDRDYKYVYIHHVDVWPLDGVWEFPKEKEVFFNIGDYGSCVMTMDTFIKIGGYSNSFWGWGGEDNELYGKVTSRGCSLIDKSKNYVNYNTKFQGHERKFNGKNYASAIKTFMLIPENEKNSVKNFDEHGSTKDLQRIGNNIYKHMVVPKKISADQYVADKVLIGYIWNMTDPELLAAYIKSAMMFSGYEFDVWLCVGDKNPNSHFIEQIKAHGVKVYIHKPSYNCLYVDRFLCYKEFLTNNPQYKTVLHTDVSDVFFQTNPFEFVKDELVIVSEGVEIGEEPWNSTTIKQMYPESIFEKIKDEKILCSGVIGGPRENFINLCDEVAKEVFGNPLLLSFNGADQLIIQKLIHNDGFKIKVCHLSDGFACHLHVVKHYPEKFNKSVKIDGNRIYNEGGRKFAIVHQYNRFSEMYRGIQTHFIKYYFPL